jgi:hypothetical protein
LCWIAAVETSQDVDFSATTEWVYWITLSRYRGAREKAIGLSGVGEVRGFSDEEDQAGRFFLRGLASDPGASTEE